MHFEPTKEKVYASDLPDVATAPMRGSAALTVSAIGRCTPVTIKEMPADVLVLDRMDIPGAFKRAPAKISSETVQRAYEVVAALHDLAGQWAALPAL